MSEHDNNKRSMWVGIGEKVVSFVVGVIVAAFILGGARVKVQTLGREMDSWKTEWKEKEKQITRMDLEGSVATKNFIANYDKEQAKQYERLKHLEDEVNKLDKLELRVERLEGRHGKDGDHTP
jgi:uncharacterized membrane-anchored protein YhcB (DUF1043 family)